MVHKFAALVRDAEFSDAFFNSPEAEALTNYKFWAVKAAAEKYKEREFHPWSAERLAKDFLKRL